METFTVMTFEKWLEEAAPCGGNLKKVVTNVILYPAFGNDDNNDDDGDKDK